MADTMSRIPWLRIGAEGVVIVASILAAFAVDAWWAERQERRIEREDLERLHAEFIWNRDRIDEFSTPARAAAASAELYELVSTHLGNSEPLQVPSELLRDVHATATFDAVSPVLDGMVLSGRLSNVRHRDVASAIALWQRHVVQVYETEVNAREFVNRELVAALVSRGNMGPMYRRTEDYAELAVDSELVGLIARRANNTNFVLRTYEGLRSSANDVVLAVESALTE